MTLLARLLDPKGDETPLKRIKPRLYSWALSRGMTVEPLDILPPDPWMGDSARGRHLLNRTLELSVGGTAIELTPNIWSDPKIASNPIQNPLIHGFEWLRDLRAIGGDQARRLGRTMLEEWLSHNRHWRPYIWDYPVTANRIASWLMAYEFFCASADDGFQDVFYAALMRQVAHLNRANPAQMSGLEALNIIRGQLFANLALKHDITPHIQALDSWLLREVNADGMHISRSPSNSLRVARHLIDLRGGLVRAGHAAPTSLQSAIERMMHAVRFFRMPDQKLTTLGASQEGDAEALESILRLSGVRIRKSPTYLQDSGYHSLIREKTHVLVDCGTPAPSPHNMGAHASPLCFEMSSGKDRLVVSCGTNKSDPIWAEYLRVTAAHSGLIIDDKNAYELIKHKGFGRSANKITAIREVTPEGIALKLEHNGYVPLNGLTHKRSLTLSGDGKILEGEDILETEAPLVKDINVAVRFHLHPRVQASLTQDGQAVLLRLPSGHGWRFYQDNASLSLEPSIYCGAGDTPRKTMQIVLSNLMQTGEYSNRIRWQFSEEH